MSAFEERNLCSKTPAGARLERYMSSVEGLKVVGADYYDRLAAVVLGSPSDAPEGSEECLMEVLKGEFTFFQAEDKTWRRVVAGILAKLESRGIILVCSTPEEES